MIFLDLVEGITEAHLEAFAAMWPQEREAAQAEVRHLLDLATKPARELTDKQAFVRRVLLRLLGDHIDLAPWFQAVAVGSFELRPDQRYVILRDGEKPGRYAQRGLKAYDEGTSARHRRAGITHQGIKEGMHLVGFMLLAKELKNLAAGPGALGPAWPIMVAVDTHLSAEEKRALYTIGADESLHRGIADAIRSAMAKSATAPKAAALIAEQRDASWRRKLPPHADLQEYIRTRSVREQQPAAEQDRAHYQEVEALILRGPRPSFVPVDVDEDVTNSKPLPFYLEMLLPISDVSKETFSKALRAIARQKLRQDLALTCPPEELSDDYRVQVWLRAWIRRGGGIPPTLPVTYYSYLEEEACLAFETFGDTWAGAPLWRRYKVIGEEPSRTRPEQLPWDLWETDPLVKWERPPRKVDRIDVGSAA